jgi:hypothetical protein
VIIVQLPSLRAPSAAEQTSHAPPQELSQQTPSAQMPLAHSFAPPQRAPSGCLGRQA